MKLGLELRWITLALARREPSMPSRWLHGTVLLGLIVETSVGIVAYYIDNAIDAETLDAVNARVLRFAI